MKRIATVILTLVVLFIVPLSAQQSSAGVASQLGMTYGELSAKWYQWAFSMPYTHHPLFDTSDCSTGQSGPVWFLGGRFCATYGSCNPQFVERSCTVPKSKSLFFPILNSDHSFIEDTAGSTEADLRSRAKADMTGTTIQATVDGRPVQPIRVCSAGTTCLSSQSPLVPFTLPAENMLGAIGETVNGPSTTDLIPDGASSMLVTDGHYVLLPPLPAGPHTIYFHGAFANGWALDVTYHVNVVP